MHRYVAILSWVETGSEAIQTCYLLYVRATIPDNKRPVCENDHSLAPSPEDWEIVELYLHFPITLHGMALD
jgi:hypothetical protein